MSFARKRKAQSCAFENCGSRRFYVGDDGYTYCDQGHQQSERGTVIAEDTGELVVRGQKSKRKDSDGESRTSRASSFSGADAFEHYLLCLQLVLRKQLRWLIDSQKLPEELESLTKDLWTLRLQKIHGKVSYDSETDTEVFSSQGFSSQSESESASASRSSRRSRKDTKLKEGTPTLVETPSLCFLAILLLRIPMTVADVHGWINSGDFVYYRASREVSLGMRERLPPRYQLLLEPQTLLQPENLHQSILETATMFNKDFGMTIRPLNIPLILYRWTRRLALPLEVFPATRRLAGLLDIDLSSFLTSKVDTNVVLRYPESQLMALLITTTKLLFPSDDIERRPHKATDLSSLSFDWDLWAELHETKEIDTEDSSRLGFARAFNFNESDCLSAEDDRIDAYLGWYEDNMASEDVRDHGRMAQDSEFRGQLFQMFPTQTHQREEERDNLPASARSILDQPLDNLGSLFHERVVQPTNSKNVDRIGSFYRRFRTVDELHGPAKSLFEKGAALAGLSPDSMVQAVFLTERKLQKLEEGLRRKSKASA